MQKLYNELARDWYQLLSPLEEYLEEAKIYHTIFQEKQQPAPSTILELGCGAGHIAFYMKRWYTLTLSDISENMLSISRRLNPECEHVPGDMKTLRLAKTFDAVFIHDAIMYMISEDDLRQALLTAYIHCKPGGVILISPDYIKEIFKPGTDDGGSDASGRGLRYLEWKQDPDPNDNTYTVDYAYMMRNADGSVQVEHDRHIEGLFSESTWRAVLKETGFDPVVTSPDSFERINFLAYKPMA